MQRAVALTVTYFIFLIYLVKILRAPYLFFIDESSFSWLLMKISGALVLFVLGLNYLNAEAKTNFFS